MHDYKPLVPCNVNVLWIYSVFVVIATLVQVYILTTICSKYANWILRNGPLRITVDFLKLKLCFKFPFYLIHSHNVTSVLIYKW